MREVNFVEPHGEKVKIQIKKDNEKQSIMNKQRTHRGLSCYVGPWYSIVTSKLSVVLTVLISGECDTVSRAG